MRIMLAVYKGYDKTPFDKVSLNADDESDITMLSEDMESWLFQAYRDMENEDE